MLLGQLPETEVWLIPLKKEKDSLLTTKSILISQQKGYNNQPCFSLNGKSLYYVSADSSGQTDILHYDLKSRKKRFVTRTAVSEYSPQEIYPGVLYSVVVEKDSSQKIHEILSSNGVHEKILEPDSVGYYCFLNHDSLLYYKLTEPHSLRLYELNTQKETWLGNSPCRGFKPINTHTLLYGLKDSLKNDLYRYHFRLQKATHLSTLPLGSEDFFWHRELGILRSEGTKILQLDESRSTWRLLFDFKMNAFHRITRFAFDPDLKYLVVVDNL